MRNPTAIAAAILLTACQAEAPDPRGVEKEETLLTVSASGRADARPDEARLQLGVMSTAASAGEASRANREKMERVSAALTRLGVKPDDLQTQNLSLQKIEYGNQRGRFRAQNILELKLRDMKRVGEAVTSVTEAGANVLAGPDLRVSDREAASKSAYAAAYRAARARADAYAEAAGLKVGRVLAIYDGGEGMIPPPHGRAVSTEAAAPDAAPSVASVPFNAGIDTTEVRVRVDFALGK